MMEEFAIVVQYSLNMFQRNYVYVSTFQMRSVELHFQVSLKKCLQTIRITYVSDIYQNMFNHSWIAVRERIDVLF